jgi:hypothetical protein
MAKKYWKNFCREKIKIEKTGVPFCFFCRIKIFITNELRKVYKKSKKLSEICPKVFATKDGNFCKFVQMDY